MTLFFAFASVQVLKLILYYNVACIGDFRNGIPFFFECTNAFLQSYYFGSSQNGRNEFLTMKLYCLQFVEIELGGDGGLTLSQFIRNSA